MAGSAAAQDSTTSRIVHAGKEPQNCRQFIALGSGGGSETERRLARIYPEAAAHIAQPASTLFVFSLPEKEK